MSGRSASPGPASADPQAVPRAIDLRSDTVTQPTAAMRDAMYEAPVGDDVFGEDPTVQELEAEVARLLGKAAAIFVPSGTMANQLAIALQTRPGDTVLTEDGAHCALFEAGGAAALSGVQFDYLPRAARWAGSALQAAVKPAGLHYAPTSLIVVENTHNVGGGRVLSPAEMDRIAHAARALGLAVHCDGARLWNAAAALGVTEQALAAGCDTVSVCFSKGLGAPVGSALCGSAELIARSRKLRKRWGGGMRQAGCIAAGALYALRHHRARLGDDHRRAAALASGLAALARSGIPLEVDYPEPGTNMVYVRFPGGGTQAQVAFLAARGVRVNAMVGGWLRAVFHLDVEEADVGRALRALTALAAPGAEP